MPDIVITVFDGVKLLDVVGPAEVFAEANRFGATYRLRYASIDDVESVRIDAARGALDGGHTVTDAAHIAGFGSAETLRRVFVTHLGVSPRAYRDRFRSAVGD